MTPLEQLALGAMCFAFLFLMSWLVRGAPLFQRRRRRWWWRGDE